MEGVNVSEAKWKISLAILSISKPELPNFRSVCCGRCYYYYYYRI